MTQAAYFVSKNAERLLVKPLLLLLDAHNIVRLEDLQGVHISSPLEAVPWDIAVVHRSGAFFVDVKLAPRARFWSRVAPQTFLDIKLSLKEGVAVLLFITPKVHLLLPHLLPVLPPELTLGFLETWAPSAPVDPSIARQVQDIYDRIVY